MKTQQNRGLLVTSYYTEIHREHSMAFRAVHQPILGFEKVLGLNLPHLLYLLIFVYFYEGMVYQSYSIMLFLIAE